MATRDFTQLLNLFVCMFYDVESDCEGLTLVAEVDNAYLPLAGALLPLDEENLNTMSQTQLIQAAKSAPKIYLGSNVTVARVHTSAVVKYGREVRLPEARTMQHVADRSTVRLPRVILACEEEDDDPDDSKNRLHVDGLRRRHRALRHLA